MSRSSGHESLIGNAILGIDTLWGGDVMCASGTGRFIADSWFSDEPLPAAYTHPAAARVRESGGVSAKAPDRAGHRRLPRRRGCRAAPFAASGSARQPRMPGLRGEYLRGLALCFEAMWDLAMEMLGKGEPVPYERCVKASTGRRRRPPIPPPKRERVAELLGPRRSSFADPRRAAGRRGRLAQARACAHGLDPRPRRGRDRSVRCLSAADICRRICPPNCSQCRAPTSTSCRSRTPGSPAR